MFLCYIDESGTPEIPGTTSHYILAGLAIPIHKWHIFEKNINDIKERYGLADSEIHTAWIARSYLAQTKIPNFEKLSCADRIIAVERYRNTELLRLARAKSKFFYAVQNHFHTYEKIFLYVFLLYL